MGSKKVEGKERPGSLQGSDNSDWSWSQRWERRGKN